ncbi:MAG: hypothetical protein K2X38_23860 [Gemmataceae bacterium]|nr:hypothetical protein [Gemmataceae bacterium]
MTTGFEQQSAPSASLTIECDSCERLWSVASSLSLYGRQALESSPCPHCGSYTLSCQQQSDWEGKKPTPRSWTSFASSF